MPSKKTTTPKGQPSKGEWEVMKDGHSSFDVMMVAVKIDKKVKLICTLPSIRGDSFVDNSSEIEANAQLLASSKLLLETLIGVIKRNEARNVNNLIPMDIRMIKSAIKKATA